MRKERKKYRGAEARAGKGEGVSHVKMKNFSIFSSHPNAL